MEKNIYIAYNKYFISLYDLQKPCSEFNSISEIHPVIYTCTCTNTILFWAKKYLIYFPWKNEYFIALIDSQKQCSEFNSTGLNLSNKCFFNEKTRYYFEQKLFIIFTVKKWIFHNFKWFAETVQRIWFNRVHTQKGLGQFD